jgi:hypothetical protein
MLFREDNEGMWAIAQPAHAWLSGQLAAAWGNERFGEFTPRNEVLLAAAQHDIGWIAWEQNPAFNPATGRPFSFLELPTADHLKIWRATAPALLPQSRYAALLVSLHGTGLYERLHDYSRDTAEEAEAARQYLADEKVVQGRLIESLAGDPAFAEAAEPATLDRNRRLLATWDAMSLFLCFGRPEEQQLRDVPASQGSLNLSLRPADREGFAFRIDPWPFHESRVVVLLDALRLPSRFPSRQALREGLKTARRAALRIDLHPPGTESA